VPELTGGPMLTLLFALLAGILTVAAPCILPVLPVLFGASIGQTSKARPVFIALGFVASFTVATIVFSTLTQVVGIDPDRLRTVAIGLLLIFGFLMLWPRPFEWLAARAGNLLDRVHRIPIRAQSGNVGGFVLGTTLGLVWTPCAGPVLASVVTVIATAPHIKWAALLLTAYAVGAAVPMLAIAYGGQFVTTRVRGIARVSHRLQQGFGALTIVFAAATYLQYDTLITAWVFEFYPNGQLGL
jgi:cytochrome c-type biogenesis protein